MKDTNPTKNYKGIVSILGVVAILICSAVGTGIINSDSLNSDILGLTSPYQNKIGEYDPKIISTDDQAIIASAASKKYIGNKNTKKLHKRNCRHVKKMKNKNKIHFSNKKKAIKSRYKPCKHCRP